MRLTDLDPRWLSPDVFIFLCPHCRKRWLSCKRVAMPVREQFELFRIARERDGFPNLVMVPMRAECAWNFDGNNFEAMTVTPSIDASPSGDWHGFITNGEVR